MAVMDSADIQKASHRFMRRAMTEPMLSAEREQELARAWLGRHDERALHALVASHFRLVVSQAAQYARRYGLSFADLMQEGNLGLMQATDRFDPDRGVRFSTYAIWWIRAAIQDYVLRNWSVVRIGTTTTEKRLFFNLRRLRGRIASVHGEQGGHDQHRKIAEMLGVSIRAVGDMDARLSGSDQSIDAPLDETGSTDWSDMLVDQRPSPEELVGERLERRAHHRWLVRAITALPPREALIIRRRHLRERAQTLEELGLELAVSKERVRQLEKRALERLRRMAPDELAAPSAVPAPAADDQRADASAA